MTCYTQTSPRRGRSLHSLVHPGTAPWHRTLARPWRTLATPLAGPLPAPRHPLAAPTQVRLQQDASGKCCMLGAVSEPLRCAADFLAVVEQAKARRATQSTGANSESSRSHAVIRLTVGPATGSPPHGGGGGGGGARPAVLTLVDCAGTERKEDSASHSADRRKEGAEINSSLHALKECLRHWLRQQGSGEGSKVHIPFRLSALTRVLAESFVREDTMVAVVGTLSPASADAEHSLATMRTVCALAGDDARVSESKEEVKPPALPKRRQAPSKWSAALVREWVAEVQGGALAELLPLLPAGLDGRALSRLSARQMGAMWRCPHKDELCTLLFNELRGEMKKVPRRPAATPGRTRLQPMR